MYFRDNAHKVNELPFEKPLGFPKQSPAIDIATAL